ncbi:MAG: hypothetical protein U0R80_13605 [Nocardioidaceae bacterium]
MVSRWLVGLGVAVCMSTATPVAAEPAGAPVEHPARAWTLRFEAAARLTPTGGGGVLVSGCLTDTRPMAWRINPSGNRRVAYRREGLAIACPPSSAFGSDGSTYVAGYREKGSNVRFGIQARRPDGTVRWTRMFGESQMVHGAPAVIGDTLWVSRYNNRHLSDELIGLDPHTGDTVVHAGLAVLSEPVLASTEGPILVEKGWGTAEDPARITWRDETGAVTASASLPPEVSVWTTSAVAGADRRVTVVGCEDGPVRVEQRTLSGPGWGWEAPAGERCTSWPLLAGTPTGGVVVGRIAGSPSSIIGTPTFTMVDENGQEVWTHVPAPPRGRTQRTTFTIRPAVDASGRIVLGSSYSYACGTGRCHQGLIEILDADGTVTRTLVTPALRNRSRHGSSLGDMALGPDRIYVALESPRDRRVIALDVPGIDG